jgi:hypothetical protein
LCATKLAALALLDDAALWKVAEALMSEEEQTELDELLSCQEAGELSETERERLHTLMDVYGRVTLRKAHAYLLLARRGYHVPMQSQPA